MGFDQKSHLLLDFSRALEGIFEELIQLQQDKILKIARERLAHLTADDITNPQDFPELCQDPLFNYEDGIGTGLMAAQMAVRARLIKPLLKEAGKAAGGKSLDTELNQNLNQGLNQNLSQDFKQAPFFAKQERLRLNREGLWFSDDCEITHDPTRTLFSKNLFRVDGPEERGSQFFNATAAKVGGYFLKIGRETKAVEVEDTPYFVERVEGEPQSGQSEMKIYINDGMSENLDVQTLRYRPGRLTCQVMRQGIFEEAKFLRAPYFDLLKHLEEDASSYFIRFGNKKVILGKKDKDKQTKKEEQKKGR